MGLSKIERICGKLIEAGLPGDTPAAAIENGTMPSQRVILSSLAELPGRSVQAGLGAPTLFVIGAVVALADRLGWQVEGRDG